MTRDTEAPVRPHNGLRLYGIFASVGVTSAIYIITYVQQMYLYIYNYTNYTIDTAVYRT
ncbi:hypothetical protein LIPSTDRAFT_71561 [Lipomyces starkeyi NRRL Y-11557]|uniref:Uncharacterized protein n=1 Tax=Lipomyces starkeyi NRRL Y-11557 TaxID=675824 RepID=A0A1E3Q889_LIPST|nr:hypothetical protein LIPSTDRAFT_71561 [Lipomyces starkeyi NRRL Y-11557]